MTKINMRWTRLILLVTFLILTSVSVVSKAGAYTNVLGTSVVVPNFQIYINGSKIEKPDKVINSVTNDPTFFGNGYSNVILNFQIQPGQIKFSTPTDNVGYWVFSLDKPLTSGSYTLYYSVSNGRVASSSAKLGATFYIPAASKSNSQGVVAIPEASLKKLDYLTVSLIVIGIVILLVFIYLLAKRREHTN